MEQKKKNKGLIITIAILIMLVIGLSGYIIYDKLYSKEKPKEVKEITKEENKEEKEEVIENLDNVAQILLNKLDKYSVDYYNDKDNVDFTSMQDSEIIQGSIDPIYLVRDNLTKKGVDDYYNNLLGKTVTSYPDYNCWSGDGVLFKYNTSINEYERQDGHAHGGACKQTNSEFMNYNNIEKNNDTYTITVTKVFAPLQGICGDSDNSFYADSERKIKIEQLNEFATTNTYGNYVQNIDGAKKYYNENYEQFKNIKPQYKYTFKKDTNDNYYLTNYEKIK